MSKEGKVIKRTLLALGIFAAAFFVCRYAAEQIHMRNLTPVDAVNVRSGTLQRLESFTGTLSFTGETQQVVFPETVQVTEILAGEGDVVDRGQVLLRYQYDETALTIQKLSLELEIRTKREALEQTSDELILELYPLYIQQYEKQLAAIQMILDGQGEVCAPIGGCLVWIAGVGEVQGGQCLAEVAASEDPELLLTYQGERKFADYIKNFAVMIKTESRQFTIVNQEEAADETYTISGVIPYSEWNLGACTSQAITFLQPQDTTYRYVLPASAVNQLTDTAGEIWLIVPSTSWTKKEEYELTKYTVKIEDNDGSLVGITVNIPYPVVEYWDMSYEEGLKVRIKSSAKVRLDDADQSKKL